MQQDPQSHLLARTVTWQEETDSRVPHIDTIIVATFLGSPVDETLIVEDNSHEFYEESTPLEEPLSFNIQDEKIKRIDGQWTA